MGELPQIATGKALAAAGEEGLVGDFFGRLAEQSLRKPQRKPLLPDSGRTLEQETGGQTPRLRGFGETFAQLVVAVQIDDGHIEI